MTTNEFKQITNKAASEGIVLLKNKDNVLPIKKGDVVSLFGRCQIEYYKSGTGSGGAVNVSYSINAVEGLMNNNVVINHELVSLYEEYIKNNPFDNGGGGWAQEPWFQKEMIVSKDLAKKAKEKSNKAIVIIGRTAGEDKDNVLQPGSYFLTEEEKTSLMNITSVFEDVIIVFNVGNVIDMSFVDSLGDKVKGILYAWHGGQEGGNALGNIISGNVNPSGKLSDTIAKDINDYPSNRNFGNELVNLYEEDIYVGYRYFETFKRDNVLYPFGYGLSYTKFQINLKQANKKKDVVDLVVEVENIGHKNGKEVVQVYCEAPQGKLGKPYVELVDFSKTTTLSPGQKQELVFSIPLYRLSSFDDGGYTGYKSAYVLEKGSYNIYFGNSVRDLTQALNFVIDDIIVVQQLEEVLAPIRDFKRMVPGLKKESGEYEITYQSVPKRSVDLQKRILNNLPKDIAYIGDQGISLKDVKENRNSLDQFISQLSIEEMALIIRGEGMSHPLVTPGTAAAFGGLYDITRKYGIPSACCADGPSGIRMDSGKKATQMPIGSLLACTWNVPLIEELYTCEGKELYQNNIDTLLGPGLNIHRHPLNGRNFEYFSEDPLVSGLFTKACVLGIRKGGSEATIKHYAANDQEKERNHIDAVASERCLREIHLKGFEIAVREGNAKSIMTAYNPINGIQSASNYDLNTSILRKEWGFNGIVMTDWWALMNDNVSGGKQSRKYTSYMLRSQNDLFMVVPNHEGRRNVRNDNTIEAIENGEITLGELQRSIKNILQFILEAPTMERELEPINKMEVQPIDTDKEYEPFENIRDLGITEDTTYYISVEEEGDYSISVFTQYNASPIAQSMINFHLNDLYIATIQMNGRGVKVINQYVATIHLFKGVYKIGISFHQPGLTVEKVKMTRV